MRMKTMRLVFCAGFGFFACHTVSAIDKSEILTNKDYKRHDVIISVEVAEIIETEGQVAMNDPRVHCERTRKRGSYLRKTYCQSHNEHFWEQTYTKTAISSRGLTVGWSSRPFFPAYKRSAYKRLRHYLDGVD